tara:strand:+ start:199 stop:444 length:246 start_codon:yes stop_codon:yes gene_type:complete
MAKAKKVSVISVTGAPANYHGARAAWYQHLQANKGKTQAQFEASAIANPPSTPKKGKLAGKVEPPAGWLAFFVRQGNAKLS